MEAQQAIQPVLAQVPRWEKIKRGQLLPPPVLVTIDPTNLCNLKCEWCNARRVQETTPLEMGWEMAEQLPMFLKDWGVEAVCIAGGGEPLLYSKIDDLIEGLVLEGIQVGVVTNGTRLDGHFEALSKCVWVGVSVDAGHPATYKNWKGVDEFQVVILQMTALVAYAKKVGGLLASDSLSYGVTYKFLVTPDNMCDMARAARLARTIGCKNIHFRPAGRPWFRLNETGERVFDRADITAFNNEIEDVLGFDDEWFGVYGATHKFDGNFQPSHPFDKCHAVFMTGVFSPAEGGYNFGLCCDRRGDDRMLLVKNGHRLGLVRQVWGNEKHWAIHDSINLSDCPRCTYKPHNEIFEQVVLKDSMTWRFI
jgi:pyruvate-formate lyase-activating enzyme